MAGLCRHPSVERGQAVTRRDLADFILLAALWGASFLFMRISAPEFGAFALMVVRCGVAAMVMLGWLALRGELGALRPMLVRSAVIGIVASAIPFALFGYALQRMPAGLASILNATTPMWTAIVAWLWFHDGLSLRRLLGIVIGFVGVVILAWSRIGDGDGDGGGAWLPMLACLLATLAYGVAANAMRRYLVGAPPLLGATGSQIGATLALLPLALQNLPASPPSLLAWASALVLAVFCSALAYLLFFRLIANVGPQRGSSVTYLIPLFGVAWGALFLGERLEVGHLIGGVIIIIGAALVLGLNTRDVVGMHRLRREPAIQLPRNQRHGGPPG